MCVARMHLSPKPNGQSITMRKPQKEECNNAVAELTKLLDQAYKESPAQAPDSSNHRTVKVMPGHKLIDIKTKNEEFNLAVGYSGSIEINRYTAAFIAALSISGQITMSKTGVVNAGLRFSDALYFNRQNLRDHARTIDAENPLIAVQQIGRNRRFNLSDTGKRLVDYARQHEVQHLSKLLKAHDNRQYEEKLDKLFRVLRSGLTKAA